MENAQSSQGGRTMTSGGMATRVANSAAKEDPEGPATVLDACVAESRSYVARSLGRVNFEPARKPGVESIEETSVAAAASVAFVTLAWASPWASAASASADAEAAVAGVAPS